MKKFIKDKYFVCLGILVFTFALIQCFLTTPYHTDKTVVSSQVSKSMSENSSIYAKDMPCFKDNGTAGSSITWAEEPPVYHLIGMIFFKLHIQDYLYKLYPLFCFLLYSFGLLKLLILIFPNLNNAQDKLAYLAIILFQPYIYIHSHRPLPDSLAAAFLVFFVFYFFKRAFIYSFLFALLAVTTKALAIFPIFFICGAYLFSKEKNFISRFSIAAFHGLSIVAFLLWIYYLKENDIINPFTSSASDAQYLAGLDFSSLLVRKFWSRVLTWVVVKGVGPLLFIGVIASMFKNRLDRLKDFKTTFIFILAGHLLYIIVLKKPIFSAPWYQFYFLPFYLILASIWLEDLKKKTKWTVVGLHIVFSMSLISLSLNFFENFNIKIPNSPYIPCLQDRDI